ncbi:SDR family NAD(P)-dependent oxidoreductase [Halobaculum sp. P14]|uniref:SDR family NAD(P)-dependent oxidoreductase n=1 Tax=Halobaculum sp. P14 TaxID=3421638 RepID=UPI003EBBE098
MGDATYDFTDETVVVTGGSSGIGRAIAERFGDAGAVVVNADERETPKDENETTPTHERIEAAGGRAEFVETDVSDPEQVESVVRGAREFGGVDVLVNNAAIYFSEPLLELEPDELDRLLSVNVRGYFTALQAAARDMVERNQPGSIVNIASISSSHAQHDQVHYDASKGAIRMLTRGAALELAEYDIRVNAVAPGQIATEFFEGWTEGAIEGAREGDFIKPVPLDRAGLPEDIAGPTLFLASDDAGYVTGAMLYVDGGWQVL